VPPTSQQKVIPGTRPAPAGHAPPARGRPAKRRGRAVLGAAAIIVVVLAAAGIGVKLLHHPAPKPPPAPASSTPTSAPLSPDATVLAYFSAINQHQYATAWRLVGERGVFSTFEAGFSGTEHDSVTIDSTNGDVVTASLAATQSDGSVKAYYGTYTVINGVITATDVQQTN